MRINTQKRLAADILKIGVSRVWVDPLGFEEISKAITKEDVRGLIKRGLIKVKPKKGISSGRSKLLNIQRKKGRRKGHGRRRGTENARGSKKRKWINKIRPLRQVLKSFRSSEKITSLVYNQLYSKLKGNFFRNSSHLKSYLERLKKE